MRQFNRSETLQNRKDLRNRSTLAERVLWSKLRNKRFFSFKFYRQYGAGLYIVDFYCPRFKLAIEADGGQHFSGEIMKYDEQREKSMRSHGIKTLRFTNLEILTNIEGVLEKIRNDINLRANSP